MACLEKFSCGSLMVQETSSNQNCVAYVIRIQLPTQLGFLKPEDGNFPTHLALFSHRRRSGYLKLFYFSLKPRFIAI